VIWKAEAPEALAVPVARIAGVQPAVAVVVAVQKFTGGRQAQSSSRRLKAMPPGSMLLTVTPAIPAPLEVNTKQLCVWAGVETRTLVEWSRERPLGGLGATAVFVVSVVAMFSQAENPFLYFQF